MRRPIAGFWWSPAAEGVPALVVAAAFFALGGLTGSLLAFRAAGSGAEALSAYLAHFLASARAGELALPGMPQLLWRTFRWPLAAFLLGFSALGLLGLPLLSVLRGFLLGFSVSAFARAYGHAGLALAFLLQGLPSVAALPVFFLLVVQSLSSAWALARRSPAQGKREPVQAGANLFRCGVCVAALAVSLLLERYLVPILVTGLAGTLLQ